MGVWVPFNLHSRCNIFQYEFAFTFIGTTCNVSFNSSFSFNNFINTEVAKVVTAALTEQHLIKITKADRAIIFKLIPLLPFLRKKVTAFNIFKFMLWLYSDIWNLYGLFLLLKWLEISLRKYMLACSKLKFSTLIPICSCAPHILIIGLPSWVKLPWTCTILWTRSILSITCSIIRNTFSFIRLYLICLLILLRCLLTTLEKTNTRALWIFPLIHSINSN